MFIVIQIDNCLEITTSKPFDTFGKALQYTLGFLDENQVHSTEDLITMLENRWGYVDEYNRDWAVHIIKV
jgi:hypothetical protein